MNISGPNRRARLGTSLLTAQNNEARERQEKIDSFRRAIDDIEARRSRLVKNPEHLGDGDIDLMHDIRSARGGAPTPL
ncbi:hypothetical protein [Actinomadura sp. NTSP31]|uniref:hypothetical protein n=1 Tax=Actinomadura sp. NTSP31 TaxID=1735447 RepID=UPI0035C1549A